MRRTTPCVRARSRRSWASRVPTSWETRSVVGFFFCIAHPVLRQYYNLGVRYATLTHSCNNAFADSGGFINPPPPKWHGLSPLGKELIKEMNRLGMLIDISHVSEQTAEQAMCVGKIALTPVT